MPTDQYTPAGDTWWFAVEAVTINDGTGAVPLTDPSQFDSFAVSLRDRAGSVIETLPLTLSTDPAHPAGTWQAAIDAPDLPGQVVTLEAVLTRGGHQRTFTGTLRIARA